MILYGDVPLTPASTLEQLVECASAGSLGLLTVNLADPTGYGRIIRDEQSKVQAIVEQKDANNEQKLVREGNSGMMAVHAQDLQRWLPTLSSDNAQGEFYLTDIIALAQGEGKQIVTTQATNEYEVLGVNNRLQQATLEREYQRQVAEKLMAEGVTLFDPTRFDCRGTMAVGSDVVIDINCVFEGQVCIGSGVIIESNCRLSNCSIADNSHIKANSVLEDCEIGSNCDVGPFARVRPGTVLADSAKLGNFVETKKAIIGKGSKVNHLTYVGDATIGENANVGAGTITCNYDGVNKWKTEIGDNAFIGSNTSLVAPVKIGVGATTGAGSTITSDIPDANLGVARGKQRNINSWKRPEKK